MRGAGDAVDLPGVLWHGGRGGGRMRRAAAVGEPLRDGRGHRHAAAGAARAPAAADVVRRGPGSRPRDRIEARGMARAGPGRARRRPGRAGPRGRPPLLLGERREGRNPGGVRPRGWIVFPPVSLTRNTVRAVLPPLCVLAIALALGACGRDEPDLESGKAQFVEKCGSCHSLERAGTAGNVGPNLDTAFQTALADGLDRDTIDGIVNRQILHPRTDSQMPAGLVKGQDAEDVAAYVGYAAAKKGSDEGALASAGLAQAKTGDQIFT